MKNSLATHVHMTQRMNQLTVMGELVFVRPLSRRPARAVLKSNRELSETALEIPWMEDLTLRHSKMRWLWHAVGYPPITNRALSIIGRLQCLRKLRINYNTALTADIDAIRTCIELQELDLEGRAPHVPNIHAPNSNGATLVSDV